MVTQLLTPSPPHHHFNLTVSCSVPFNHKIIIKISQNLTNSYHRGTPRTHTCRCCMCSMHDGKGQGSSIKRCPMRFPPYISLICLYLSVFSSHREIPTLQCDGLLKENFSSSATLSALVCAAGFPAPGVPGHSPLTKCVTRLRALFLDPHEEIGVTQSVVYVYLCANIFIFLFLAG